MNTLQPRRIQVLLRQLRPDLAETEARRQLARFPESSQLQALLGLSLIRQNKPAESRSAAERAVVLDAQNDFAFYVLSLACLQGGQLQEAALHIATALQLQPVVPDYHFIQGSVAFAEGHAEAALTAADQGLCLHPQHVQCLNLRARALSRLAEEAERQQQPAAAETHYRETLRIQPTQPTPQAKLLALLLQRAQQALLQNQLEAARTAFLEVRHLDPDNEAALTGLVHIIKHNSFLHRLAFRWETYAEQAQSRAKCGNLVGIAQLFLVIVPVISFLCLPIIALYLYVGLYWRLHPDIRRIRNRPGLARPYAHQTLYRYGLPGSLCLLLLAILPGLIGTLAPFGATSMNALSGGLTPIILIAADAFKKAAKGPLPENSPLKWLLLSAAVLVSSITCACWPATWPYGPLVSLAVTGGLLMYLFRQMHPRNPL